MTTPDNSQPRAEQAHTPTPWRVHHIDHAICGKQPWIVADNTHGKVRTFIADAGFDCDSAPTREICEANVAFIVAACNQHASLLARNAELRSALEVLLSAQEYGQSAASRGRARQQARVALAATEGRS